MDDIFVAQLMTSDLKTVTPDTLVEDAAGVMLEEGIGSLVVVDDAGRLEGILTTTDFVKIVAERKPKDQTPVSAYMTSEVITASAQDDIREVSDAMIDHGIHHVPIVDGEDGVIGIVTTTDLAAYVASPDRPSAV